MMPEPICCECGGPHTCQTCPTFGPYHDPLAGYDRGPCADYAPDTLGDDPAVCTTCYYTGADHYATDPVRETEQRCRCANDDAGPCPNYPDDDEEAPYCADCYTARVYGISRADCPHDERSL